MAEVRPKFKENVFIPLCSKDLFKLFSIYVDLSTIKVEL